MTEIEILLPLRLFIGYREIELPEEVLKKCLSMLKSQSKKRGREEKGDT